MAVFIYITELNTGILYYFIDFIDFTAVQDGDFHLHYGIKHRHLVLLYKLNNFIDLITL